MNNLLFWIGLAALGGIAITLQGYFMGLMDQSIGTRESVFITYFSGGIFAGMVMLLAGGGNLRGWAAAPWYSFSAGLLGLLIVGTIGYVVPRLGLVVGFTILTAAQFLSSAAMDHFGLLGGAVAPISASRLIGIGVMLCGIWLIMR